MKKKIFLLLATNALAACASIQPIQMRGPKGRVAYSMTCSGMGRTIEACFAKAGEICPNGYDIVDRVSGLSAVPAPNGGIIAGTQHSLIVECKDEAPERGSKLSEDGVVVGAEDVQSTSEEVPVSPKPHVKPDRLTKGDSHTPMRRKDTGVRVAVGALYNFADELQYDKLTVSDGSTSVTGKAKEALERSPGECTEFCVTSSNNVG